jgi:phosphoglucomutase
MSEVSEARARYEDWLNDPAIDSATKAELQAISEQPAEIEDRFYKELEFGTGGLRGVIGAGTNRINPYTVGKATQGLSRYIREKAEQLGQTPAVAIAYDSRHMSPEFAQEAALVLAGSGVKAYLFEGLRTTPELSFAVRHLGATGGIVITASHNPPEYNGYKVYGPDGGQLVPDQAELVIGYIKEITSLSQVKKLSQADALAQGLLVSIGEAVDRAFIKVVASTLPAGEAGREAAADLKVVYTPLHGTGNVPVREVLAQAGFTQVAVVPEQEKPDANFSTVKSPNPEERAAFELAIKLAEQTSADIIIGTDPDCDRVGAVVRNSEGAYTVLSGNQSGAIMVHYLLTQLKNQGKLPADGVVIKTIVTSEMGADIARAHGLQVMNTLTGFKYIGEKMTQFEQAGGTPQYVFGYEESYGYLAGTYARDKDAVLASALLCEAAAHYKQQGKSLYDVLLELYEEYGYFLEHLESITLKGKDGMEKMVAIMDSWRSNGPAEVAGNAVTEALDYRQGLDGLPVENVLKYRLSDGSWFCLRPSGTEPKIKLYFAVRGTSVENAKQRLAKLTEAVLSRVE